MKTPRNKISKLPDQEVVALWVETSDKEYAGVLLLRYLPFLYGVCLKISCDPLKAKEDLSDFSDVFQQKLAGYDDSVDFAKWLHEQISQFERERHSAGKNENNLTVEQKEFILNLAAGDEKATIVFEQEKEKLSKPQRECIQLFFLKKETFESIAGRAGYLTDNVRSYIESGITTLVPSAKMAACHEALSNFSAERFVGDYVDYLRGSRSDLKAHDLELSSMLYPFLSEALNGCIGRTADQTKGFSEIERNIEAAFLGEAKSRKWLIPLVALAALFVVFLIYWICFTPPADLADASSEANGQAVRILPETIISDTKPEDMLLDAVEPENNGDASYVLASVVENGNGNGNGNGNDSTNTKQIARLISISENTALQNNGDTAYVSVPKIGLRKFNDYLRRAAVVPEDGVKGDVGITFNVNRYGRPSQMRVIEYVSQDAHREAIRLLDNGPEWTATDEMVTVVIRFE